MSLQSLQLSADRGVEGLGFRGLGFRVEGLGFRGLGFRGFGFRVELLGLYRCVGFRAQLSG